MGRAVVVAVKLVAARVLKVVVRAASLEAVGKVERVVVRAAGTVARAVTAELTAVVALKAATAVAVGCQVNRH